MFKLVLVALLIAAGLHSQSAAPLEFEVASVKPAAPVATLSRGGTGPWGFQIDPGRLHATNITLYELFRQAYHLKYYQIDGNPSWFQSVTYDVDAKAPSAATRDEILIMLRKLLADRFHLKFHKETKEIPVMALMVSKGGPKNMEPARRDDPDPATPPISRPGEPVTMRKTSMEVVAAFLTASDAMHDTPVLDKTGLQGLFNITYTPVRDETTGRTVFDSMIGALPELGLELKRQKAPIDIFTIDSADKTPIEN